MGLSSSAEILTTRLDESLTHHFQLGLTNVFKFQIFTMAGLTKMFRNVFWTHQNKLLQVFLCSGHWFLTSSLTPLTWVHAKIHTTSVSIHRYPLIVADFPNKLIITMPDSFSCFVSDLWQVCGFLRVLRLPPPMKLTAMI